MALKPLAFRLLAVALPLVLLAVLEGVLRVAGVAADQRLPFQPIPGNEAYVALNPAYAQRYFTGFLPGVAFTPFERDKRPDTFRVFALGGSTTAGFPYHFYYGFPAHLEARLSALMPARTVEVVNLGMTAVNSYTLWDLKDAVLAQQPDAVVIYAGHNEYYGAFGAGSSIYALGNRLWLKRLTLRLKRTVLYTLLEQLLSRAPQGEAPSDASRTMMARVVRNATIARGDATYEAGLRQFEANMRDVLLPFRKAGIPVYLATLAANLGDQPPLGDEPTALQAYRRGRDLQAAGDAEAARKAYLEAKELDDIRFRAPEAINAGIRTFALEPGVTLVDVQEHFRSNSLQGIEGSSLFEDHLHPSAAGYALMADAFFDALKTHPRLNSVPPDDAPAARTPVDPFEQAHASLQIQRLKGGYPFNKTITPEAEARAFRELLDRYHSSRRYPDSLAVLALTTALPVQEALNRGILLARSRADTLTALLLYRSLLHWQPFNEQLMEAAVGYALAAPRFDPVVTEMAWFNANRTGSTYSLNALAALLLRRGDLKTSATLLDLVEARDPSSSAMLFNKARLLVMQGDTLGARRYFERYRAAE